MKTEELLVEWGLWLQHSDSGMHGYSSPSLDMVRANGTDKLPALPPHTIDEATAQMVDRLVATLIKHDENKGRSLVMYYAWRESLREIANRWDIDKNKVQQIIQNAVSWIDGAWHQSL